MNNKGFWVGLIPRNLSFILLILTIRLAVSPVMETSKDLIACVLIVGCSFMWQIAEDWSRQ